MQYDPIKRSLGKVFDRTPFLRKVFYFLLDLLLLRAWHVHKELKAFSKAGAGDDLEVLDGGAGFGQYTFWMNQRHPGWNITAIDVKEEQVADCNQFFEAIGSKDKVHFQVGDLTKYVKPETYDLVICVDVMEHIEEDVQVFKNYFASMKPGAMLLISTPSDQGGSGIDEHTEGEVHGFIDEHVRDGYNIKEIQEKLKSAGYQRVEARYQYGAPGKIAWRLSMMYPLKALNATKLFFIILPIYYIITYPISYILNWMDVSGDHDLGSGLVVKAWK